MIKSENLLLELFESAGTVVLFTDENYRIRFSSASVQTILGLEPISLAGKSVFDFVPIDKKNLWRECLEKAGNSKRAQIQLKSSKEEDLYFDVTVANRLTHHEIRGMVIIMHDISEQKRQHVQLEKKNEHLDQFIYKTTHDLRSPIQTVMGLLNLIENASDQERMRYLRMAHKSLVTLESLIEEVNDLYRVDKMAIAHEKINFRELVEEEIANLKNHPRGQHIDFQTHFSRNTDVFTDPLRLKTVLGNILSNAVKYSDDRKPKSIIHVDAVSDENGLVVAILDNGIGIAKENIGKIFDIFFRATTQASGTGLGLHIVKDTIDRLNGKIDVQSQLGIGTQFKIYIPHRSTIAEEAALLGHGEETLL